MSGSIRLGLPVVTRDKAFARIPGLKVIRC